MASEDPFIGEVLGQYRILSRLGSGGMGTVYLAERDDKLRLRVALKILNETGDPLASQRFMRERQLLSRLRHPNIARILDSGETPVGTYWFAMELVEGTSLSEYLRQEHLSLEEKLKLFRLICDAVSYAHQNLIIHRDLKPSNIMVDQQGKPILLDFGVAGFLDSEGGEQTQTLLGRAFTPQYASPEQMRGVPLSASSDVYALGLIFYELISGVQPYVITPHSPQIAIELICEKPVTRPSEVLKQSSFEASEQMRSKLKGDLDIIAVKALAKNPEERYHSVEQLSLDLDCYFSDFPIFSRPTSVWYRTRKLLKRNALLVTIISFAFVFLLASLAYSLYLQRAASMEVIRAMRTKQFLANILTQIGPGLRTGSPDAAHMILKSAEANLSSYFYDDYDSQAEVSLTIIEAYNTMNLYDEVERLVLNFPVEVSQIQSENLKYQVVLALSGICRSQACKDQSLEVFSEIKKWDLEFLSNSTLEQYIFVLSALKSWHDEFDAEHEFYTVQKEVERRKDLFLLIRLGTLSYRIELPNAYAYETAMKARQMIDDQARSCSEIIRAVNSVDYLFYVLGEFEEARCLHIQYADYLNECVMLAEKPLDLMIKQFELHRSEVLVNYVLKRPISYVNRYHTLDDAVQQNRFGSINLANVYYSVLKAQSEDDVATVSHLMDRALEAQTLSELDEAWHEGYLVIGLAVEQIMQKQFDRAVELLEGALTLESLLENHRFHMKTLLAQCYGELGHHKQAEALVKEVRTYASTLDEREKAMNWFWLDQLKQL